MPNNSKETSNSVNQLMPTLQPFSAGMSTYCYTSHRSSIPLPKFSGDLQELNLLISILNDRATIEHLSEIELLNAIHNSLEDQARQYFLQCNEISPNKNHCRNFQQIKRILST